MHGLKHRKHSSSQRATIFKYIGVNSNMRRPSGLLQHGKKYFTSLYSRLSAFLVLSARLAREQWLGTEVEKSKIIIHQASVLRALRKCAIHFAPIIATIILAGYNLGTYFIGREFLGPDAGYWQDFDRLALQVAAKVYVCAHHFITVRDFYASVR
jgi:hypothetical protein